MTVAPVYLVLTGLFSMNAFDLLFRTPAFYVLTVIVRTGNAKLFVLMGFILGLGLLSKIGVLFLGSGLALGLMLTPARRYLKSGYLWGPGDRSGEVAIVLGVDRRTLMDIYEEVTERR
jgi:4-amino-4-deoxy-L-arabinose transferase-like glycosyltransferase